MADVSTITANGITYNVKDSTARTDVAALETTILTKQTKLITRTVNISSASTAQTIGSVSGDSDITANMVVVQATIGNPEYQTSSWTVTTSSGGLTINGTASAATTITLILSEV